MGRQLEEKDLKLAEKDGELSRCERVLADVRGMLSDKTIANNKNQSNLSNEVTVLSDRIQALEREKVELVDKYSRYGEEFKQLL